MTPGERGVDMSGECACRCLRYVLVEVYGKCGPESTRNPTTWGADRGQEERHTRAGPTSLCWPMRKKNVKPTSPGNTLLKALGGDLHSIHFIKETTLGALEKPLPASRVQWLSRLGV